MTETTRYGMRRRLGLPYEAAVERVTEAIGAEGFGVLTEIDVRETLKKKLDVEFRPYVILGACNPPLAHQALSSELEIGLLLPCNLIVYQGERRDESVVAALDPVEQLKISGNPELGEVAREVRARIERVLSTVASA